jgi:hypothetical protein
LYLPIIERETKEEEEEEEKKKSIHTVPSA